MDDTKLQTSGEVGRNMNLRDHDLASFSKESHWFTQGCELEVNVEIWYSSRTDALQGRWVSWWDHPYRITAFYKPSKPPHVLKPNLGAGLLLNSNNEIHRLWKNNFFAKENHQNGIWSLKYGQWRLFKLKSSIEKCQKQCVREHCFRTLVHKRSQR